MKKKKHKGCSYMKVNPLDPRRKTTIKNQKKLNSLIRTNNQLNEEFKIVQRMVHRLHW